MKLCVKSVSPGVGAGLTEQQKQRAPPLGQPVSARKEWLGKPQTLGFIYRGLSPQGSRAHCSKACGLVQPLFDDTVAAYTCALESHSPGFGSAQPGLWAWPSYVSVKATKAHNERYVLFEPSGRLLCADVVEEQLGI